MAHLTHRFSPRYSVEKTIRWWYIVLFLCHTPTVILHHYSKTQCSSDENNPRLRPMLYKHNHLCWKRKPKTNHLPTKFKIPLHQPTQQSILMSILRPILKQSKQLPKTPPPSKTSSNSQSHTQHLQLRKSDRKSNSSSNKTKPSPIHPSRFIHPARSKDDRT